MKALAFAIALAFPACVSAHPEVGAMLDQAIDWRPVDAATGQIRDIAGLEQLAEDFPDSGNIRLRMLQPYLEAGEMENVLATLEWLNARGYVFGEVVQQQIPKLVGREYAERAQELLLPEHEPIERSTLFALVPAEAGLIESVLREPEEDRLIATGVTAHGVFGKKPHGSWDGYRPEGAANISGIAHDPARSIVWLGVGAIDGSQAADDEFRGLIGMPTGGSEEVRIAAPGDVSLSDIVVAAEGTIYASDPIGGGLYFAKRDEDKLLTLIAPGTFRSPQGLAVSADGERLYISDYRYGIAIVDLETKIVSRLSSQLPLILDGVDGMWIYENELIVVQNGTSPIRIAGLRLSDDGKQVIGRRIIEQAHAEWTEPLSGSIDGDALLYVANGQWDRYVAGEIAEGKSPVATEIRRVSLSAE